MGTPDAAVHLVAIVGDLGVGGGNGDNRGDGTDLHLQVDGGGAADGDRLLANNLAKTGDLAADLIAADGECGRAELAFGAGLQFAAEAGFDVGDADGHVEDDPARFVEDCASNCLRRGLGEGDRTQEKR